MGFPMEVETNSEAILRAARVAWDRYPRLAEAAPVRLRITVSAGQKQSPPTLAQSRVVFDREWMSIDQPDCANHPCTNHARANLDEGWGTVDLDAESAADSAYVNYHFLEPLAYLLLAPRHYAFAHASCIARNGRALVLCGEAEAGKTCLAYSCARNGWTFLSGDATHFLHTGNEFSVAGRPFSIRFRESARDLLPELRAWPAALRPNQKMSIEVDTRKLNVLTAMRARASHLVFLKRCASGVARLEPISREHAERRLCNAVFFGEDTIREGQRATLSRFASLASMRLVYSDLPNAEATLRTLLPEGA